MPFALEKQASVKRKAIGSGLVHGYVRMISITS